LADPIQSPFGDAYLAVVERSTVSFEVVYYHTDIQIIITVVKGIYELYPEISARHWFYWVCRFLPSTPSLLYSALALDIVAPDIR